MAADIQLVASAPPVSVENVHQWKPNDLQIPRQKAKISGSVWRFNIGQVSILRSEGIVKMLRLR